ncbi:MAG: transcription termination/antitermination protein NusA, partial [Alphaproteobacteria bacterium]|nr:transcription termination/antitermination protein NusA [Alphaproteobacteria bacterium]
GDELTDSEEGYLREFRLDLNLANGLIMSARIAAGWFTAEELAAAQEIESEDNSDIESEAASV